MRHETSKSRRTGMPLRDLLDTVRVPFELLQCIARREDHGQHTSRCRIVLTRFRSAPAPREYLSTHAHEQRRWLCVLHVLGRRESLEIGCSELDQARVPGPNTASGFQDRDELLL